MGSGGFMIIKADILRSFYYSLFRAVNTPEEEAAITADGLLDADLYGLETHGALRIPIYIGGAMDGRVQAANKPFVEWRKKAVTLIDGNNTWGQPAAVMAVNEVINNAKLHGVGVASIKNTNHIGTCAYYAKILAKKGLLCFVTTNTAPNMPPWGGSEPVLGTNPVCFSAPASGGELIVFDMATSVVSKGKIMLAAEKGEAIPEGWALDKNGCATTDAKAALNGYMLPLGGPKGYGLALFSDIFSGVLSGSNFGTDVRTMLKKGNEPAGVGAFMWAVEIDLFGRDDFEDRMACLISMLTGVKLAEGVGKIYLPGERGRQTAEERRIHGIPVSSSVLKKLNQTAKELNVPQLVTDEENC
jgi:LDH2 family malate/lactate/ureidoglycolate dehydrogenase